MDIFRRHKFNEAMFAKNRTLAIRVGRYQSSDIKEANFEYGYIKGDTYKPGGTCAGSAKIVFTSIITTFNKLDKIYPEIGLLVDGTYEWVKMGEYFINDIEIDRNRNTTTLDLMDGMFKLNREYVTDLTYPADIKNVIKEICLKTGVELANENIGIASMNYQIDKVPENKKMTFRDVLSLSTQMLGMSCFFNREGKLEIKGLTDSGITITADNYFLHGLTRSEVEYQIAGITCKKDKETLTVGLRTGRSLEIENVLMYQSALDNLYYNIKDIRYYPFSLNYQGYLLLDVGQWVTIKTNTGEKFKSPILSQSFNFKGGLRGRISADSKAGNDAQYSYAGTITKKILQFDNFEAQLQNKIEEADREFDAKVDQIKQDFSDQIKLVEAKTEEDKRALSEEINRRFQDFSPAGFDEAKAKAEEALKKAGTSSDLAEQVKGLVDTTRQNLDTFKSQVYNNFVTDNQLRSDLSTAKTELKKYVKEETDEKTSAIRETIANGFVAKSTYLENVEGVNQRFETLKRDNEIKLADYKQGIDGRFANFASQMAGKVNQIDFQRVRETAQLYERILGNTDNGIADNVSRMALTSQLFQVEVAKNVGDSRNFVRNADFREGSKNWTLKTSNGLNINFDHSITQRKQTGAHIYGQVTNSTSGFEQKIKITSKSGSKITLSLLLSKDGEARFSGLRIGLQLRNNNSDISQLWKDIPNRDIPWEKYKRLDFTFDIGSDIDEVVLKLYGEQGKTINLYISEIKLETGSQATSFTLAPEDTEEAIAGTNSKLEATRTQVTQLAGSYAIRNLNSAGDLINGINFAANGNNRIIGRATHISGETLIDNAVIKSAMIDKLKTANFEAGSVTTNILGAEAVTAEKVKFDTAFIQRLVSQQAFINELFAKQATITKIQSIDFTGNHIKGGRISSLNGKATFDLQSGWIDMNQPGVGIRNQFAGRPIQYLVFGQGSLHGKDGSYTTLMSNSNNKVAMDDGAAGIQIWNTNDNTSAVNIYGDMIDFMYNASDPRSIHFDTIKNEISNLETIWIKGKSLEIILNDIFWNFRVLFDGGANLPYGVYKYWNGNK
ncbi:tail fiber domain-containing protein [Streptococcus infantis]|uniref:tail fiber domain-containing protein n=1 Tax=Streptococcus infantis TaxID=68892 RepID=UPI0039C227B8